jgi:hypothetical protein
MSESMVDTEDLKDATEKKFDEIFRKFPKATNAQLVEMTGHAKSTCSRHRARFFGMTSKTDSFIKEGSALDSLIGGGGGRGGASGRAAKKLLRTLINYVGTERAIRILIKEMGDIK